MIRQYRIVTKTPETTQQILMPGIHKALYMIPSVQEAVRFVKKHPFVEMVGIRMAARFYSVVVFAGTTLEDTSFPLEDWRNIEEYENHYQVSDLGNIRSVKQDQNRTKPSGTLLRPTLDSADRYLRVTLSKDNQKKTCLIHQLVLTAFHGPRPDGFVACHNNGNATDNCEWNLRWDTQSNNYKDGVKHGTCKMVCIKRSDGVVFPSLSEASRSMGVTFESIRQAVMSGDKCKGLTLEIVEQ